MRKGLLVCIINLLIAPVVNVLRVGRLGKETEDFVSKMTFLKPGNDHREKPNLCCMHKALI